MTTRDVQNSPDRPELLRRLQEMTCYLPYLEDSDFSPGEIRPAEKTETGSIIMPCAILGDVAETFDTAAYDRGWILRGFDWVSWRRSDDAQALCSDPSALARAEPIQLLYLITALIRQDRFSEGTLLGAFETRLILGIVCRAAVIIEEEKRQSRS